MNVFFRFLIRISEILITSFFKIYFGRKISLGKNIRFHKTTKLIIEKDCVFHLGNNFVCRRNCTFRVVKSNMERNGKKGNVGFLKIGKNCFFNESCSITAMQKVEIGDDCIFGENVHIYDHNHNYKDPDNLIRCQGFSCGNVKIGQNCWIGTNAVILKGVTIGNNSIVQAGTVVYKNVPENSVLLSNGNLMKEVKSQVAFETKSCY